jgi:hypothetical protein
MIEEKMCDDDSSGKRRIGAKKKGEGVREMQKNDGASVCQLLRPSVALVTD